MPATSYKTIFTLLLTVTLSLTLRVCTAQDRIIIMIDSTIFNKSNNIANLDVFKRSFANEIPGKIVRFRDPAVLNTYSLYVYSPTKGAFYAREIFSGEHWHDINSLNKYASAFSNISGAKLYGSAYDFLKDFDIRAANSKSGIASAGETILVVLSQSGFAYSSNPGIASMLTFKLIPGNDAITFNYVTASFKPDSAGEARPIRIGIQEYHVKKTDNVFLGPGQQLPLTYNSMRVTLPGTSTLNITPKDNYTNLKLNLKNDDKIKIDSVSLSYIKGKDSQYNLLPNGRIVTFKSSDNTLPGGFGESVGMGSTFPFFEMLQPYLKLNASVPTDTAYYGQFIVKYQLFDIADPLIKFADTITFKFNIDKPRNLYLGLTGKILLDNAGLIKYGNKLSPRKPISQDELINKHGSLLRYLIYIIIGLLILIIILVWYFLIKKKKLTLSNARTFWK